MAWFDDLQPASFREVPFHVDTIEHQAGDNVVLREYPFQDLPTVFRMGEGAEDIKFSAYVIGDDYIAKRDALRNVLSGDGVLVHPTAGRLRVFVASKFSIKENPTAEGGMARFDLHFVRADARRYPEGVANTSQQATVQADLVKKAAADAFVASWSLNGRPGWVAEGALSRLAKTLTALWGPLSSATQNLQGLRNSIVGNYQALRTGLEDLVRGPRLLADAVTSLFELPQALSQATVRDFQSAFDWVFDIQKRLADVGFETSIMPAEGAGLVLYGTGTPPVLSGGGLAQLAQLNAASDLFIEAMATAAFVQASAALELVNYDEATALRSKTHAQMLRLLLRASSAPAAATLPASSLHDALLALHGSALADLQARSLNLARMSSYTPEGWLSIWSISYLLYGSSDYADEIMALNAHITHPLLVPPGRALRIARHD
jgi:prophage DNA circulation protein